MTDYGVDPVGDGTFKLVPSGRILTRAELEEWQKQRKRRDIQDDCLGLSWDQIEAMQGGKLKRDI